MGRSSGYRPRVAVRKEILFLRAELAKLQDDEWVKAGMIMQELTKLLGHTGGPMGGRIEPRACRYCHYFGHTRQWCKKRIADEEERERREIEAMLKEDEALFSSIQEPQTREPYEPTRCKQALTFDELQIPYTISPYCGPIIGVPGGDHAGMWTFDTNGEVVSRA